METPDVATGERKHDLPLADPLWLWQLAEGAKRVLQGVLGAVVAAVVLGGLAAAAEGLLRSSNAALGLLGLLFLMEIGLGLLALSGLWSLTAAQPGQRYGSSVFRCGTLARAAMGGLLAATVVATLSPGHGVGEEIAYVIAACVWVMLTSLAACVAGQLRRSRIDSLAKRARALAWAFGLTPVLAALSAVPWYEMGRPIAWDSWLSAVLTISTIVWGALLIPLLFVLGKARREFARAAEEAWTLRTPPATLQLDEHSRIAMDVPCRQCGYNLRGLDPNVGCPECGAASKPSIDVHLLRAQDPIWPSEVATGMTWLLITLGASLVLVAATRALYAATTWQGLPMSNWYGLISPIGSLLGLGTLVGIWKITTPTFGSRQADGDRARQTARFCLWLRLVLSLNFPGMLLGGRILFTYVTVFGSSLSGLIGWVAMLRHCQRLAERAAEPLLAEHARKAARQVAWLLGLMLAFTVWMNVDHYLLNRTLAMGSMPAGVSPRAVLREGLSWLTFGLHATFTILMLRLAYGYRKRFRLIAQSSETPGPAAAAGLDVSASGT
jgi:hypothetical protein